MRYMNFSVLSVFWLKTFIRSTTVMVAVAPLYKRPIWQLDINSLSVVSVM